MIFRRPEEITFHTAAREDLGGFVDVLGMFPSCIVSRLGAAVELCLQLVSSLKLVFEQARRKVTAPRVALDQLVGRSGSTVLIGLR